jgi:TolB-like protein/Tfp pilus assembly protein PilF
MSLFAELKSRNVFKIAVAYIALSWLMLQVVDTMQDPLRLPDWSLNLFLALALFGFPLALVLAWALDLTAQGVQKADSTATSKGARIKFSLLVVTVVIGVGITLWANWEVVEPYTPAILHSDNPEGLTSQTPVTGQSIAVLPFVNMSGDPDNEYFSDGISEELLHGLTNLDSELRVAARTSSFYFKGKDVDIATIGKKLNVATVLEGSVRRAGDRVRITAQLINVADGYHLWSESYDRRLDDIFAVQDEIARAIVDALEVELGVQSEGPLIGAGTGDPDAYAAFLQGRQLLQLGGFSEGLEQFQTAVEIDPNFANAWAEIAAVYAMRSVFKPFEDTMPHARRAFERALEIDPDNGRALATKGGYILRTSWNWPLAIDYYQRALASDADPANMVTAYVNVILLPLVQTERARQLYTELLENDPLNPNIGASLMLMDVVEGNLPEVIRRFKELKPDVRGDAAGLYLLRCSAHELARDIEGLEAFVNNYPVPLPCKMLLANLKGDSLAVDSMLAAMELTNVSGPISRLVRVMAYDGRGNVEELNDILEDMYQQRDAMARMQRLIGTMRGTWDVWMQNPRLRALAEKKGLDDASVEELLRTVKL